MADRPLPYVDLGSPYAYLAVGRAPGDRRRALLGTEPAYYGDDRLAAAAA